MSYKVEWENQMDNAESPLEAANGCFEDIRDGQALAFTVTDLKTGKVYSVDLNETVGDEVMEINNDR